MACDQEWNDLQESFQDYKDAIQRADEAADRWRDERGFWEEETLGTGAGVATIIGAGIAIVVTDGLGGIIIGILGAGAGTGAALYSETDRYDDIEAAWREYEAAARETQRVYDDLQEALRDYCSCHYQVS